MKITNVDQGLTIESEKGSHNIVIDKHEELEIDLGINRVRIFYSGGRWQIGANKNIQLFHQDTAQFFVK